MSKELIDELRACVERGIYSGGGYQYVEVSPETARDAADALEEAEWERDRLDEAFDRDLPWRYDEVETQRNQLAAVVEKVRAVMAETCCGDDEVCEHDDHAWADYYGEKVADISILLASAPADALREVKADVWDEGYFRRMDDYPFDPEERDNPYRKEQS